MMNELSRIGTVVEERLKVLINQKCEPGVLKDAIAYSLLGGGKRLRPALCMMSAGLFGDMSRALDFACAIEMIHTYSLIHDDLPSMDNDVLRRGKPTNHVVFGEAMALLAGDALLNWAYEVMLDSAVKADAKNQVKAMKIIADAAGVKGMIAGQVADISFEGADISEDVLHYIHERKTGALICASVLSGAALLGASDDDLLALDTYGKQIGLVFQIVDDILDEIGNAQDLGKSVGKDKDTGKLTFARVYGIDESRRIAQSRTAAAVEALERFGERATPLCEVAQMLVNRDR